jgi:predicted dithiol-disulfide oxidoreductase (DUF899 family)
MADSIDTREWLAARRELLAAEKAFQDARDDLATKRRALPRQAPLPEYVFNGEFGPRSFAQLFEDHSQLIVYHFMFHPDWDEGCKSCSFWADSFDSMIPHLGARDVAFAVISHAPLEKLLEYRERMGWRFPWLSAFENSFNFDFGVSFTQEETESGDACYNYRDGPVEGREKPGLSVFQKDGDEIYHTYSTYARGLDNLNPVYQTLDLTPRGRDEGDLPYPQDWVRRHDEY